ncbi:aminotransferase class V-fold PLP-dependent enzyme [Streptomyces sp. MUM 203J]|uniref:aminotransferase class V-fold PLP-dependent enzyme n=1 Tax=Streptomyces sp. MUM 203J TaxID=2791990 RepID=UPI001F0402D6|nr:aminotransferase class V-fold PLP-dependent enzyme [Streptomyces sp. MUM 203J]MCH0539586.1 aminotransferase class V-fold PLP-dependent enzyme [Streptomyces sp. MUM 203J]
MDTLEPLAPLGGDEFAPAHTYLNTAACGLLPRRTADAVRRFTDQNAAGGPDGIGSLDSIDHARALFARLAGVGPDRVAIGAAVSVHVALIAGSLPQGAEVLVPEGEFSSLVSPFAVRRDLRTRMVPLEDLAGAIRPGTALVAFSAVQSADGRTADLAAIREAAAAHGTRTLLDATQSAGWLPLDAGAYDYTVTGTYKFLLCPRGATFLTVSEEAQETLVPLHAGWFAGEEVYDCYGPVRRFPPTARRFDEGPVLHAYQGAEQSLQLILELGVDAIHAHDTALAARFRDGLAALGHKPVPADSSIVAVPGLGDRRAALAEAGVLTSARAGNLRAAFHLYNSSADVDRALRVLAD